MKKWLCLLCALLCLCAMVTGCGGKKSDDNTIATTTRGPLTKDEAIAAAEAHWNMRSGDRDPDTGYMLSVVIVEFPGEENPYFRAVLRSMVEVDGEPSHPSQLDEVLVHQITGEITTVDKE